MYTVGFRVIVIILSREDDGGKVTCLSRHATTISIAESLNVGQLTLYISTRHKNNFCYIQQCLTFVLNWFHMVMSISFLSLTVEVTISSLQLDVTILWNS